MAGVGHWSETGWTGGIVVDARTSTDENEYNCSPDIIDSYQLGHFIFAMKTQDILARDN